MRVAALSLAAAAAFVVEVQGEAVRTDSYVDCGDHFADNCGECTKVHQLEQFCGGVCVWKENSCLAKTDPAAADDSDAGWFSQFMSQVVQVAISGLIMGFFAFMYKRQVVDEFPRELTEYRPEEVLGWKTREKGLFDCCQDKSTCLYACFCPSVVTAKNFQVGKVCGFWPTCVVMFVGMAFPPLACLVVLVKTHLSRKLKRNLWIESSFMKDFFINLCCFPCEVGRESMEVDEEAEVEVTCYNKVRDTRPPMATQGFGTGCCSARK